MSADHTANMALWNKLELTDTRFVNQVKLDGRRVTTVDQLYNVKRLTEELGPVGFAWGWEVKTERTETYGEGQDQQTIHTAVVRAWFRQQDGSLGHVEHVGTTKMAYWTRPQGGAPRFFIDHEAPKKSVTDALKKIMVNLGASADIWLGRFDGDKYVPPQVQGEDEADERRERPVAPREARSPEAVTVDEARVGKCRRVVEKEIAAGSWAYADPAAGTLSQPFVSADEACRDLLEVMAESPTGWVAAAMRANEPLINAAGDETAREVASLYMRKNNGKGANGHGNGRAPASAASEGAPR